MKNIIFYLNFVELFCSGLADMIFVVVVYHVSILAKEQGPKVDEVDLALS